MNRIPFFIDFDYTLFNTREFRAALFQGFEQAGFSSQLIHNLYEQRDRALEYDPNYHLELLSQHEQGSVEQARANMQTLSKTAKTYLFPDVIPLLSRINREAYSPQLLTLGHPGYQELKVANTGILDFFEKAHYCQDEKWRFLRTLVEEPDRYLLLDDRSETIILTIRSFPKAHGIIIDRARIERPNRYSRLSIVHSLAEVERLTLPTGYAPLLLPTAPAL